MENIVELKDVCFRYGSIHVLQDVNFSIGRNKFVGIIGPNGGGKTTILKLILGLLEPSKGEIRVFGRKPKDARNFIGYVPQYAGFDRDFPISVFEVVLLGSLGSKKLLSDYPSKSKNKASESLKRVGMLEYKDRQIDALSGGQIQRVLIARALMTEPSLLILDEPLSSVDPNFQNSFYKLLTEFKKEMSILLVTHDVSVASIYIDSIACLNKNLYYHGSVEGGIKKLEKVYGCPVELIAHGHTPHRVLKRHNDV